MGGYTILLKFDYLSKIDSFSVRRPGTSYWGFYGGGVHDFTKIWFFSKSGGTFLEKNLQLKKTFNLQEERKFVFFLKKSFLKMFLRISKKKNGYFKKKKWCQIW